MQESKIETKMILDLDIGRYSAIHLAREWIKVYRVTDEGRNLTIAELIKKSLDGVISGDIDEEAIKKLRLLRNKHLLQPTEGELKLASVEEKTDGKK
jgi:hypothetical protein